jgi:hypothetical protein
MDGFKLQHKQIQSLQMSDMAMRGDLPNQNKLIRWDANNISYNVWAKLLSYCRLENNFNFNSFAGFGSLAGTNDKWTGFVAASNGILYSFPTNTTTILRVDPFTDTVSTILNVGTNRYSGGVLVGDFIYGIPTGATTLQKLNWKTEQLINYASIPTDNTFIGGALANNGKIYCPPFSGSGILVIDPRTDTYYRFGNISGSNRYIGAVVVGDFIYSMPFGVNGILKIDTTNDTFEILGGATGSGYHGTVLGEDGNVYGVPFTATQILSINPKNNVISIIPLGGLQNSKIGAILLAGTGNILFVPYSSDQVLLYNVFTKNFITIILAGPDTGKYRGGTISINGNIYLTPGLRTQVGKIPTSKFEMYDLDYVCNRSINNY